MFDVQHARLAIQGSTGFVLRTLIRTGDAPSGS